MNNITVRRANIGDIGAIMRLLEQVLLVHHNGRPDLFREDGTKYTVEELETIIRDESTPVFVAEADGSVVGHAFCIAQKHESSRVFNDFHTLYIDDICVDEKHRMSGVGKSLFDAVRAYAKDSGFYNLTLNVWAENKAAMRFYEDCGMTEQRRGMELIL